MRWLSAGIAYVNFAAVAAVLLGMIGGGLNRAIAVLSLLCGLAGAIAAFWWTVDDRKPKRRPPGEESSPNVSLRKVKRAERARTTALRATRFRHLDLFHRALGLSAGSCPAQHPACG